LLDSKGPAAEGAEGRGDSQGSKRLSAFLWCVKESRLTDDERVVALDPPVRGEDQENEPDCHRLTVLGDGVPVELDDVGESFDVVAAAEGEPLGAMYSSANSAALRYPISTKACESVIG
jgi:hypothetical protein